MTRFPTVCQACRRGGKTAQPFTAVAKSARAHGVSLPLSHDGRPALRPSHREPLHPRRNRVAASPTTPRRRPVRCGPPSPACPSRDVPPGRPNVPSASVPQGTARCTGRHRQLPSSRAPDFEPYSQDTRPRPCPSTASVPAPARRPSCIVPCPYRFTHGFPDNSALPALYQNPPGNANFCRCQGCFSGAAGLRLRVRVSLLGPRRAPASGGNLPTLRMTPRMD